MIRVYVAAPSSLFRAGLESAVRSTGSLELARVVSTQQLAEEPDEIAADILLVALPHFDEEWAAVLAQHTMPAVLLTDTADAAMFALGLRANVRAVLSTAATPAEIVAAVHGAAAGLFTLQKPGLELMMAAENRPTQSALEEPLSPREKEVLGMVAEGASNKIIAYRLGISEHTVKFHVTSIMQKLRSGSRTEAVMQGIRNGLVLI